MTRLTAQFSSDRMVREYVERGGIFICTVGYPEAGPSRPLDTDCCGISPPRLLATRFQGVPIRRAWTPR